MNFAADQLDMWWPASRAVPPARATVVRRWRGRAARATTSTRPGRRSGAISPTGFERCCRHAPPNVDLRLRARGRRGGRAGRRRWLLRTGGSGPQLRRGAARDRPPGPSGVFPVERRLSRDAVAPGATVAIRGFALTFIDAALALTEGAAARSSRLDHPYRLRYLPGGDDAGVIFPFSRTGGPCSPSPGRRRSARPALGALAAQGRARIADLAGAVDLLGELLPILRRSPARTWPPRRGETTQPAHRAGPPARRGRRRRRRVDEPTAGRGDRAIAGVAPGCARPTCAWALGHTWRALYPAIVVAPRRRRARRARLAGVPAPRGRAGAGRVRAARGQRRQAARADRRRARRPRRTSAGAPGEPHGRTA